MEPAYVGIALFVMLAAGVALAVRPAAKRPPPAPALPPDPEAEAMVQRAVDFLLMAPLDELSAHYSTPEHRLTRGERYVFSAPACMRVWVKTTTRVGYSGASLRIPIVAGLSYRVGSYRPHFATTTNLSPPSPGTIVITNKRVLFNPRDPSQKNWSKTWSSLSNWDIFDNGVSISPTSGPSVFIDVQSMGGCPPSHVLYSGLIRGHQEYHD